MNVPLRVRVWWVRAWFDAAPWLRPAPMEDRCCMGSRIGEMYRCRRRALGIDGLWCHRHDNEGDRLPPADPKASTE